MTVLRFRQSSAAVRLQKKAVRAVDGRPAKYAAERAVEEGNTKGRCMNSGPLFITEV